MALTRTGNRKSINNSKAQLTVVCFKLKRTAVRMSLTTDIFNKYLYLNSYRDGVPEIIQKPAFVFLMRPRLPL